MFSEYHRLTELSGSQVVERPLSILPEVEPPKLNFSGLYRVEFCGSILKLFTKTLPQIGKAFEAQTI